MQVILASGPLFEEFEKKKKTLVRGGRQNNVGDQKKFYLLADL